jgi:hypothetical protein
MELDRDSILRAAATTAAKMDNNHTPAQTVPPQPVPTSVQLASTQGMNGDKYVIITLITPVGQNVFFFDPESADKIADALKETARLSRTGLEIAR